MKRARRDRIKRKARGSEQTGLAGVTRRQETMRQKPLDKEALAGQNGLWGDLSSAFCPQA